MAPRLCRTKFGVPLESSWSQDDDLMDVGPILGPRTGLWADFRITKETGWRASASRARVLYIGPGEGEEGINQGFRLCAQSGRES